MSQSLSPRHFARIKKQREQRRRERSARADAIGVALRSALDRPEVRSAIAVAIADAIERRELCRAIERFIDRNGPALFRRIAALAVVAKDGSELAADLGHVAPAWPRVVVQESTVVDAIQYRRSPVGFGPKRMRAGDREWTEIRADTLNISGVAATWAEQLAFIESVMATPKDMRGSYLVAHVKLYSAPTVAQRRDWYRSVNQSLHRITAKVERLERRHRYALDSVLHHRPSGWQRAKAPPDTRPVAPKPIAPLYGYWRGDRLDVYDPERTKEDKNDLGYVGAFQNVDEVLTRYKRSLTVRKAERIIIGYETRTRKMLGVDTIVSEPIYGEEGETFEYSPEA